MTLLAQHDVTRFGDYFTSTTGTLTKDEESSGVIEITSLLARADGKKYFFLTTQNHAADTSANSAELVEASFDFPHVRSLHLGSVRQLLLG